MKMFWDKVAGIYDIFVYIINKKTHDVLCRKVAAYINDTDDVLECACGTGLLTTVIADRCHSVIASDYSLNMLRQTQKKCSGYGNIKFEQADIMCLKYHDKSFNKVIAGNVIHLLDDPFKALKELERVCKDDGMIIIPTYINRNTKGEDSSFSKVIDKTGADFKRQFTFETYQCFFKDAGYSNVDYELIDGKIPCAIAVIRK